MRNDILSRYETAQALMQGIQSNKVVINDAVFPHWFENSQAFWYLKETHEGKELRLVDVETASNKPAFDHEALAEVLSKQSHRACDPCDLPIRNVCITYSPRLVHFDMSNKRWEFNQDSKNCREINPVPLGLSSPDGKSTVYAREHNLWIRDNISGQEKALTQDGTADYCYAPACEHDPILTQGLWSRDSKRLLTVILDLREVASRPTIHFVPTDGSVHPQLTLTKRAYPGDKHTDVYRLISIDVSTGNRQETDYPPLPVSGWRFGLFTGDHLAWWSCDNRHAFFIDVARGAKAVRVVEFDTDTGISRVLFEEVSKTFINLHSGVFDLPLFVPLPESDELIWFSERTDWGHLYLYDLNTGELKHQITGISPEGGKWRIRDILHYDVERRELLVQTAARDQSINPYYRDICLVNIDTRVLTPLISGNFDHDVYHHCSFPVRVRKGWRLDTDSNGVSPDGQNLVVTRSRVDTIPISFLIDRKGQEILTIETADVSGLPSGWQWPEPVRLIAADDQTDIYGVIFRPPGFDLNTRYPVLDFSCGLRNISFVPQGSFVNGDLLDLGYMCGAALAALGFIVVAINGRGTPNRNKTFQDHNYGDVASTNDFNDRIAGLRQLAKRYPYMDLERVGITGLDNIANSIYGLLNHPDFYKLAVMHCYSDPRFALPSYGEHFDGITPDNIDASKTIYAEDNVDALKGKLLLIHGMLDDYWSPAGTFRLVDALQKANKDFDMLCLPNVGQDVPAYALRRNWDYLVKHLQGIEPPHEFCLITGVDIAIDRLVNSE